MAFKTAEEFQGEVLRLAFEHFASQTSGVRTPKRNAAVGGHPRSRHLTGYASDLVLDDMTPEAIADFIRTASERGILAINEGDHIHCQPLGPEGRPA